MDNLKQVIKQAVPGGPALPVTNDKGKVIGYCGLSEQVGINTKPQDPLKDFSRIAEAIKNNEMNFKFPIGSQVRFSEAGRKRFCNSYANLDRVFTVEKYDRTGGVAKVSHPAWKLLNSYAVQYLELANNSEDL